MISNEVLLEKINNLSDRLAKIEVAVKEITDQSNKWRGAFGVILVFGGVAGSLVTWLLSNIRW